MLRGDGTAATVRVGYIDDDSDAPPSAPACARTDEGMVITVAEENTIRDDEMSGSGTTEQEIAGEGFGSSQLIGDECDVVEVDVLEAKGAALASVSTVELAAKGSAIGKATVEGDAEVSGSLVGMVSAGSVGLYRGAAMVMVGDGESAIEQGFADIVVTRAIGMNKSGAGVVVANDASVARSWVGVMAARNATLSADSRVIIDAKALMVLVLALLGGMGALAFIVFPRARGMMRRSHMSWRHMPWARRHGFAHDIVKMMPDMAKRVPDIAKKVSDIDLGDIARLAKAPVVAGVMSRMHLSR